MGFPYKKKSSEEVTDELHPLRIIQMNGIVSPLLPRILSLDFFHAGLIASISDYSPNSSQSECQTLSKLIHTVIEMGREYNSVFVLPNSPHIVTSNYIPEQDVISPTLSQEHFLPVKKVAILKTIQNLQKGAVTFTEEEQVGDNLSSCLASGAITLCNTPLAHFVTSDDLLVGEKPKKAAPLSFQCVGPYAPRFVPPLVAVPLNPPSMIKFLDQEGVQLLRRLVKLFVNHVTHS